MPSIFGPILAQMVAVAVGGRTEARAIYGEDKHYEASARPNAQFDLRWRRDSLSLGYGASLTVTPLESEPRSLLIFQGANLNYTHRWKLTSLTVGESFGYGRLNFQTLGVQDPNGLGLSGNGTGTAKPPPVPLGSFIDPQTGAITGTGKQPVINQIRGSDRQVLYQSFATNISVNHRISAAATVFGAASYFVSGAVEAADSDLYPSVKGPIFSGGTWYRLTGADALSTTATVQYAMSSRSVSSWIAMVTEGWAHRLTPRTNTQLGVGLSGTRTPDPSGLTRYSIYPTFNAGITHFTRLASGKFVAGFTAASAPSLDLVSATVDPRLSFGANVGWSRHKFSTNAALFTSVSVAGEGSTTAFSSLGGSAGVAYALTKALSVDGGLRLSYQTLQRTTLVPFTYALFAGLTLAIPVYSDVR